MEFIIKWNKIGQINSINIEEGGIWVFALENFGYFYPNDEFLKESQKELDFPNFFVHPATLTPELIN